MDIVFREEGGNGVTLWIMTYLDAEVEDKYSKHIHDSLSAFAAIFDT